MNAPDKLNEVKEEAQNMASDALSWPQRKWAELKARLDNLHQSNFEMGVRFADAGQLKDALFRFKMAVYFRPKFPEAWFNLGVVHLRLGEMRQAKIALKKAVSLRENYEEAAYMLATIDLAGMPAELRPTKMPVRMMQGFFEQAAPVYDQVEQQNNYQGGPAVFEFARKYLTKPAELTLIDVGCGIGHATMPFASMTKEAIGLDVTPAMAEAARRQMRDAEHPLFKQTHHADICALPSGVGAAGMADLVLCVNVSQFVGELTQALHYMTWLLKPGGIIALTYEPCGGESYGVMQKTARFAHSDPYVRERAEAVKLKLVAKEKVALYPGVFSECVILQKPEAAT